MMLSSLECQQEYDAAVRMRTRVPLPPELMALPASYDKPKPRASPQIQASTWMTASHSNPYMSPLSTPPALHRAPQHFHRQQSPVLLPQQQPQHQALQLQPPIGPSEIQPLMQIKANLIARRDAGRQQFARVNSPPSYLSDSTSSMYNVNSSQTVISTTSEEQLVFVKQTHHHQMCVRVDEPTPVLQHHHATPTPGPVSPVATTPLGTRLPSFREVFVSPRQRSKSEDLRCKYRTGKCTNMRALKSCGEYHNLCSYHRLRANANQRKLDRKKKVQRQQLLTTVSPSTTSHLDLVRPFQYSYAVSNGSDHSRRQPFVEAAHTPVLTSHCASVTRHPW